MTLAGGKNVLAESPIQYPRTSLEQILAADPEFILDMGDFAHASGKPGQPEQEIRALWGKYSQLKAVRQNHVRVIGSEVFIRPGPRLVDAAVELQRILHPETVR
jgi:iron complex transport system substrate-binding protein